VAQLLMFGPAREAAGEGRAEIRGRTVADILTEAETRYGPKFARVVAASRIWVNGQPANADATVADQDEVAVIPPVSGG
jgi:molybdopterin converting factor small subunit